MAGDGTTVERLRQYLREVPPSARLLMIAELERNLLRGDQSAGTHFMLEELRAIAREQRQGGPRIGHSARLFFKPLEPFLVDDIAAHQHPGRIARAALEPLWTWIRRDLLPRQAATLTEGVSEALLADDNARAEKLTRSFQDRVAGAVGATFAAAAIDERPRSRMLAQIGTPRAAEDATVLLHALKFREPLDALVAPLPLQIANLAVARLDEAKALIDAAVARNPEILLPALLVVMSRLVARWQLIRLAVKAAGTDIAARVADTPYEIAVTIVLAELERLIGELKSGFEGGRGVAVGAQLKTIHDTIQGLSSELVLPVDSGWGRMLAEQRERLSDLIRTQVEAMPGRVQQLLRPRPSAEIRPDSTLDPNEVAVAEAIVEFVGNSRQFAGDPAVAELTQRAFAELRQYLDESSRTLLDGFRHAGEADRRFRQSQVDAVARLCAIVCGADYAAPLFKAAEVEEAPEFRLARA